LVPVDSIGVEQGDSNYVMGGVEGVAFGPDGDIAVYYHNITKKGEIK
jgi:hypothetical protein